MYLSHREQYNRKKIRVTRIQITFFFFFLIEGFVFFRSSFSINVKLPRMVTYRGDLYKILHVSEKATLQEIKTVSIII